MLHPDFLEIRLDLLDSTSLLSEIANNQRVPLIATIKRTNEGGYFRGGEEKRRQILIEAAQVGFGYVDLDLAFHRPKKLIRELTEQDVRVIISSHDRRRTPKPQELRRILNRELAYSPQICKIVTTARSTSDNLSILNFLEGCSPDNKVVSFAMGTEGRISRILSPLFGAYFTFAALDKQSATAPGQLSITELREAWGMFQVGLNVHNRYYEDLRHNRKSR